MVSFKARYGRKAYVARYETVEVAIEQDFDVSSFTYDQALLLLQEAVEHFIAEYKPEPSVMTASGQSGKVRY